MLENTDEWADGLIETFGLDQAVVDTAIENVWLRHDLSDEYQTQVVALAEQMKLLTTIQDVPAVDDIFDTQFVD